MQTVEVAVGVILDADGRRVLVSRRHQQAHQGGKWEFPGGKREPSESITDALSRELQEELGIAIKSCEPLIRIRHDYPEKTVLLDVRTVTRFEGVPHGREGQPVVWKPVAELDSDDFPPANRAIIQALRLPDRCLVTPDASEYPLTEFIDRVEAALRGGIRLLQFRSHALLRQDYFDLAGEIAAISAGYNAQCLLNAPPAWWPALLDSGIRAAGFHLTGQALREIPQRPEGLLGASCHTREDVERANSIRADFIFISPVKPTASHPGVPGLGWDNFAALTEQAAIPAYALGGLVAADVATARQHGAQGIAAIRGLWPDFKNT
jgi:8-oxo-dGTP diphosphatase